MYACVSVSIMIIILSCIKSTKHNSLHKIYQWVVNKCIFTIAFIFVINYITNKRSTLIYEYQFNKNEFDLKYFYVLFFSRAHKQVGGER